MLIAAALGVNAAVLREAFSRMRPACGGSEPSASRVRANKTVLRAAHAAHAAHGVTNERLDTVSDYYRYTPGLNSLWTNRPAVASALVKDGAIIGYKLLHDGSGYTTPPVARVTGFPHAHPTVSLVFGTNLAANGSILSSSG